ncbi:hypothetical protein ACSNOI_10875 [Actinomadura kijaniata]
MANVRFPKGEETLMVAVKSSVKQVRYVMGAMTAVFFGSCSGS